MNMTVFKKHNRKRAVTAVSAFLISLAVSMNVLAWFAKGRDYIPVDTYRGSVRTAYFNGGNGTAPAAGTTADDYKDPGTAYPSYDNDNDTGDSLSGPYQIDNATQLYNFAWLQYLGYFNGENASQTYFVLTSNIDASGLVLPPVGNEDNPFIGNFNGNGYTISGLTVSNDKTELNNASIGDKFSIPHAAMENNELKSDLEIVGLFGVIGDYSEDYTASSSAPSVSDLTIEDVAIETVSTQALAGIAAGYVNGVMDNVTVAGTSTISSSADTALSYTDKLSDYALVGYCEEAYRRTLKVENVSVNEPIIENGSGRFGTEGQGEAWGNTIDMHDMFTRLKSEYDALNGHTSVSYASSKTITHNTDGTDTEVGGSTSQHAVTVDGYRVRMTDQSSGNDDSYAFIQRTNVENNFIYLYGDTLIDTVQVTTTEIWKYDSFYIKDQGTNNYLAVSSNAAANATTAETAGKWVFEEDTATGKYAIFTIDSNTKKYLTTINGNLGISTTAFSGWEVNGARTSISVNDHYLCWNSTDSEWELRSPPKNYICDTAEGNYLSLEKNGNTISFTNKMSASNATEWDIEPESGGYKISTVLDGARYSLYYDQTNDVFKPSADHHSVWYENTTELKNKLYVNAGGEGVHKALYYDSDEAEWRLTDYFTGNAGYNWGGSLDFQAFNARLFSLLNSGNAIYSTGNKYLAYYNGNDNKISVARGGSGGAQTYFSNNPNTNQIIFNLMGNGNQSVTFQSKTDTLNLPGTILPLIVNDDYSTSEKNTGYLVSGSESLSSTNGTIRSASYQMRFISNSLDNANNTNVQVRSGSGGRYPNYSPEYVEILTNKQASYSSGTNGFVLIKDELAGKNASHTVTNSSAMAGFTKNDNTTPSKLGLTKYNSARNQMDEVLNGASFIHGIHFWGQSGSSTALISTSNKITINDAWINGDNYNGYELLKNSVDFNLKEEGKINLFAGSYYSRTETTGSYADSFFSLYKVSRNGNSITGVQRIDYIYYNKNYNETDPNSEKYIYRFDGASAPSGYTNSDLAFDMRYLTAEPPVKNALYYFEVPVNAGEYAMGCVTGKEGGAYLMYLDISTSDIAEGDAKIKSEGTAITATSSQSTGKVQISETQSRSENIETPPTYFPLLWDANDPTAVSADNKGYIISGANTVSNPPGDIRVSKYSRDTGDWNIKNSLVNGVLTDSIMYTIDSGGLKTIAQYDPKNFCKYVTSKAQMQALLNDTNVYGLHFMDASIGMNNILTVPTAHLDGVTYTEYEMPRNCIDINIENRGYINFFAGTFFNERDDSFFSLHRIERYTSSDNIPAGKKVNDIKDIKEIRNIYQRTVNGSTEYLYQYEGESAPDASQGWEQIFDLNWIRQQQDLDNIVRNAVYYFEIPIDPGEYALGSVDGGTGAYLLYLDVCTTKGDAVVTSEKMTVETGTYVVPAGVEFDEAALMVFEIPMSTTGDITFTAEDESVTASHSLTATVSTADSVTETVTLYDYEGKVTACRVTAGQSVTYKYAVNDSQLAVSDFQTAGKYFNVSEILNNEATILEYHYRLTGQNTVENSAQLEYTLVDHLDADGFTITDYNVTCEASDEQTEAIVDTFDSTKTYLRFQGDARDEDDEVVIPVA